MKPKILIAESLGMSADAVTELERVGTVVVADLDREALRLAIPEAAVLWVRLRTRIDQELLALAPGLRFVASPTTGLDHIDLAAAAALGIEVLSLRDSGNFLDDVRATAEHTLGLTLALLRHLPEAVADVRAGRWDRDRFKGHEICRKTVGILGYGRLGRLVAGYMKALGARVMACDPYVNAGEVELVDLDTLLSSADILSIHATLTDETRGMLGARELARLPRGAVLVNTSRGDIVDDGALLSALEAGQLAGAALDVLGGESATGVEHLALVRYARDHENLIVTPHLGGCTYESMAMTEVFLARRVTSALKAAQLI